MTQLQILQAPTAGPAIERIYHIADLHIRSGDAVRARIAEYRAVFRAFIDRLAAANRETTAVVIAGDLFHHKGRLDMPGAKLFFEFMDQLQQHAAGVLVIPGNHDIRQEDQTYPDMIQTMLAPYANEYSRIYSLSKTGHYQFRNIGIGTVAITDTLQPANTAGIRENLPDFPPAEAFEGVPGITATIAVFHGTVSRSRGVRGQKGYALDWFRGYSRVLLGDLHIQQVNRAKLAAAPAAGADAAPAAEIIWGYPGSLVQQDFGESLLGHGYLLWEVGGSGRPTKHHIDNDCAMLSVKLDPENPAELIVFLTPQESRPLSQLIDYQIRLPKTPRLRIITEDGSCQDKVLALCAAADIRPSEIMLLFANAASSGGPGATADAAAEAAAGGDDMTLSNLNCPEQWREYVAEHVPAQPDEFYDLLLTPENLRIPTETLAEIPTIFEKTQERNAAIQKCIDEYRAAGAAAAAPGSGPAAVGDFRLRYVAWDYVMCYGANNYVNFDSLDGKIVLVNGANASGKSSFLDVICIGLFGEPSSIRTAGVAQGATASGKLIHDNRPAHKTPMNVRILFQIGEETYEILRSFTKKPMAKDPMTPVIQPMQTTIQRLAAEGVGGVVAEGTTATNAWIARNIGSIESVLMSSIIQQIDLSNFFYSKPTEQKTLLDTALNLGSVSQYARVLHESILGHNHILGRLSTGMDTLESVGGGAGGPTAGDTEAAEAALEKYSKQRDRIRDRISAAGGSSSASATAPGTAAKMRERAEALEAQLATVNIGEAELADATAAAADLRRELAEIPAGTGAGAAVAARTAEPAEIRAALVAHKAAEVPAYPRPTTTAANIGIPDAADADAAQARLESGIHTETIANIKRELERIHPTRAERDRPKWTARYAEWTQRTAAAAAGPETAAEITTRIGLIHAHIDAVADKESERQRLLDDIAAAAALEAELADLPYNPDCAACRRLPMRVLLESQKTRRTAAEAGLKKLQRFLVKCGLSSRAAADPAAVAEHLRTQRAALATATADLKAREYYETTQADIAAEAAEWERAAAENAAANELRAALEQATAAAAADEHTVAAARYGQRLAWRQRLDELHAALRETLLARLAVYENAETYQAMRAELRECRVALDRLKLVEVDRQIAELKKTIAAAAAAEEKRRSVEEKRGRYAAAIGTLTRRRDALVRLEQAFVGGAGAAVGYKEWVYRERVLPILEREINRTLAAVDFISLRIHYRNQRFIFTLEDRGNQPMLEHASGFQKFIINLAMRAALTRMAAWLKKINFWVIDEGFVACDSANLEKTHSILENLKAYCGLDTIIIMSHLETVREAADVQITIEREGVFSVLRQGAAVAAAGAAAAPAAARPSRRRTAAAAGAVNLENAAA